MREVVIYPGSFNPVHNGHTAVASYIAGAGICDEVWVTVSPRNPLKSGSDLAPDTDRLEMARIAVRERSGADKVHVSDAEFGLPRPSYTIDTLDHLAGKYPDTKFSLLVGTDILPGLHKWKDWERLVNEYRIFVYPRSGSEYRQIAPEMRILQDAPQVDISSTGIRAALAEGAGLSGMVSPGVASYIYDKGLWVGDSAARRLDALNRTVASGGATAADLLERGKLLYRRSEFGAALNDFLKVQDTDPDNTEAQEYITMLNDIFEYRNMDIYNP